MLELTTINTTELTNKKLGTQLNAIKNLIDTMTRDELLEVKEYIEKRL